MFSLQARLATLAVASRRPCGKARSWRASGLEALAVAKDAGIAHLIYVSVAHPAAAVDRSPVGIRVVDVPAIRAA
jgi:hypothetical protein